MYFFPWTVTPPLPLIHSAANTAPSLQTTPSWDWGPERPQMEPIFTVSAAAEGVTEPINNSAPTAGTSQELKSRFSTILFLPVFLFF